MATTHTFIPLSEELKQNIQNVFNGKKLNISLQEYLPENIANISNKKTTSWDSTEVVSIRTSKEGHLVLNSMRGFSCYLVVGHTLILFSEIGKKIIGLVDFSSTRINWDSVQNEFKEEENKDKRLHLPPNHSC